MSLKTLLILVLSGSACLFCAGAQAQSDGSTLITFNPKADGGALVKIRADAGPSMIPALHFNFGSPVRVLFAEPVVDIQVDTPFDGDALPRVRIIHGTVELTTDDYFVGNFGVPQPFDVDPQDPSVVLGTFMNNTETRIDNVAIGQDNLPSAAFENTPDVCETVGVDYPCGYDYYYNVTMRITKPGTYHMVQTFNQFQDLSPAFCAPGDECAPPELFQEEWTLHVTDE